jgi:hypothetical protein
MHAKWTRTGCMKSLLPIFVALLLFTAAQANATYHHFAGASKMAKGTRVEFQTGKMSAHQMLTVVENLKQSVNAKTSKEYKATLQLDEVAIQNALANPNNAGAQRDLQAAQLDLSIKQDQTQKALTVGGGADRVKIIVKTLHESQEVGGYLVRANPLTAANQIPARYIFTNPTSPTDRVVPPGAFSMWLVKDGKQLARRTVSVGGDGRPEQAPIIFYVP